MRGYVGVTDLDWYRFLLPRPDLREVNFWRPGATSLRTLGRGEPFFFKLKSPAHAIGGFGLFAHYERLPVWLAWDVFGQANGALDEFELLQRLARLGNWPSGAIGPDHEIGCVSVVEPVFFEPDDWVAPPAGWGRQTVSGAYLELESGEGQRIWRECLERAAVRAAHFEWVGDALDAQRRGKPVLIRPRLGQGSFRLAVLDAYDKACAVTREHSLPVLEAAHIRPWAQGGAHEIPNGLPLRSDLHRLFDLGYVTVRPDHRFRVSTKLRDEWHNGRVYYALDGQELRLPADPLQRPSRDVLEWHGDEVFRR